MYSNVMYVPLCQVYLIHRKEPILLECTYDKYLRYFTFTLSLIMTSVIAILFIYDHRVKLFKIF